MVLIKMNQNIILSEDKVNDIDNLEDNESIDLDDTTTSSDDSYEMEENDEENDEEEDSDLDGFIVDDEEELLDIDGNSIEGKEEEEKKAMEDFEEILKDLRKPKLTLNPYPTLNAHWKEKELKDVPEFKNEKERVKWLIENKLGPNMTLADYVKFLDDQEKEVVDAYIRKSKRRKLNDNNEDDKKDTKK